LAREFILDIKDSEMLIGSRKMSLLNQLIVNKTLYQLA